MDTHYIHDIVNMEVKTGKHYDTLDVKTATGEYIFFCEDTDQLKELLVKALDSVPETNYPEDISAAGLADKERFAKIVADGEAGLKAIL